MRTSSTIASGRLALAGFLVIIAVSCGSSDDGADPAPSTDAAGSGSASDDNEPTQVTEPTEPNQVTEPTEATESAAPSVTSAPAAPGSPIVPASSIDLGAVPPATAIVVIGDEALVYSVEGPGARKCLAVRGGELVVGRFVDESGEVMTIDGLNVGELTLNRGDDGAPALFVTDNRRGWGAGPIDIGVDVDTTGGQVDEPEIDLSVIRGSATLVDLVGADGATVDAQFVINCN